MSNLQGQNTVPQITEKSQIHCHDTGCHTVVSTDVARAPASLACGDEQRDLLY